MTDRARVHRRARFRFAGTILAALLLVALLVLWPAARRVLDDPGYAAQVFDGLLPYDRVLASRRWNPPFAGWGCTFAVVELGEDAPAAPVSRGADEAGWSFARGGDWQPTPAAPLKDTTRDAIDACAGDIGAEATAKIAAALSREGSWYLRDPVGETVHVYSPLEGVAARIRYGD